MTEKQNKFRLAPIPQKEKQLPYMYTVAVLTKKRKCSSYKVDMNRLKLSKGSNLQLDESFFKIHCQPRILAHPATTVPNHWCIFSLIAAFDHNSLLNSVKIEEFLPFA